MIKIYKELELERVKKEEAAGIHRTDEQMNHHLGSEQRMQDFLADNTSARVTKSDAKMAVYNSTQDEIADNRDFNVPNLLNLLDATAQSYCKSAPTNYDAQDARVRAFAANYLVALADRYHDKQAALDHVLGLATQLVNAISVDDDVADHQAFKRVGQRLGREAHVEQQRPLTQALQNVYDDYRAMERAVNSNTLH